MEQPIDKYKQELLLYKEWADSLKVPKGMSAMEALGSSDYAKAQRWNAKLQGMESVLGLSDKEIKAVEIECGIKQDEE